MPSPVEDVENVLGRSGPCHIGLVVADLQESMASLGSAVGLTWATPQSRTLDGWTPDGPLQTTVGVTWSHQGPAHLELIEGSEGTLWHATAGTMLHHIAYWSGELVDDVDRFRHLGYELEVTGAGGDGVPTSFAYVKRSDDLRVELMSITMREQFDRWLAGGELPPVVR